MEPEVPLSFPDRDVEETGCVGDGRGSHLKKPSLRRISSFSGRAFPSVSRKTGCRRHENFEALPGHLQATVLWASDRVPEETDKTYPYVATETVHVDPRDESRYSPSDFVRQTDAFDIRVEGMYTESFDPRLPIVGQKNELVLYSLETDEESANIKEKESK